MDEAMVSEVMRKIAKARWAKATPAQRAAQAKKMTAGRIKAARKRRGNK